MLIDYGRLSLRDRRSLSHLDDSKVRSPEEREELYPLVVRAAERVAVTVRCVRGIDARGLHVTNLAALARSIERVAVPGAVCLVDGFSVPSWPSTTGRWSTATQPAPQSPPPRWSRR